MQLWEATNGKANNIRGRKIICKRGDIPFVYLGFLLGANPSWAQTWWPVVEKVEARIENWENRFLSIAARVQLIKSILVALPTFYMSLIKIPASISYKIESLCKKFLWAGNIERRILIMWVEMWYAWTDLWGELGIPKIIEMNQALLMKWWWRFGTKEGALWRRVIASKYNYQNSSVLPHSVIPNGASQCWRGIIKVATANKNNALHPTNCFSMAVGCGDKISFWDEIWLREVKLKTCFSRIYGLALNKTGVIDFVSRESCTWKWCTDLCRKIFNWEIDQWNELMKCFGDVVFPKN